MDDTVYVGADLSNRDLRGKDLTRLVLFRTDLRGANLRGAHITLDCATFDQAKFDDKQIALLLGMLTLADIPDGWKAGLRALAVEISGEPGFKAIERYLQLV